MGVAPIMIDFLISPINTATLLAPLGLGGIVYEKLVSSGKHKTASLLIGIILAFITYFILYLLCGLIGFPYWMKWFY